MSDRITPQALTYIANDFACNAEHPADRERLKEVVRAALDQAADALTTAQAEIASLRSLLAQAEGALEPFANMAGELFARNYNLEDVAWTIRRPDGSQERLTFKDFHGARTTLAAIRAAKEKTDA